MSVCILCPHHQEHERSATPLINESNEVDEVANKIYARLAQAARHGEGQKEGCSFMEFRKQNPQLLLVQLILW
jgi:hypothetical protein